MAIQGSDPARHRKGPALAAGPLGLGAVGLGASGTVC